MKTKLLGLMAALALLGSTAAANASPYVVTLEQVGANVVATGSGSIDTTGLSLGITSQQFSYINPDLDVIVTGPTADLTPVQLYSGTITGPSSFGTAGGAFASSGSGDAVGFGGTLEEDVLVPVGYVSDSVLSDVSTYDDTTLATLGATPGNYVWTWGTGDQSFTLDIIGAGFCSNVTCELHSTPLPSTWLMLLSGFVGLGFVAYRGTKKNAVAIAAA
jgi:hypothetical protein